MVCHLHSSRGPLSIAAHPCHSYKYVNSDGVRNTVTSIISKFFDSKHLFLSVVNQSTPGVTKNKGRSRGLINLPCSCRNDVIICIYKGIGLADKNR